MRKCKWCEKDFEPRRRDQVFCRRKCKDYHCRWKGDSEQSGKWKQRGGRLRITHSEYQKLFDAQNGKCAICHKPKGKIAFMVDHNHNTGKIRGLLCWTCNRGLGFFHDNADKLLAAAGYLKNTNKI